MVNCRALRAGNFGPKDAIDYCFSCGAWERALSSRLDKVIGGVGAGCTPTACGRI